MQYTQSKIDQANNINLVDFLQSQGEELIKSGKEYRWKEHDSVCINHNQWFQYSQNKGGYPVDFVMNFCGISFSDAVETLLNFQGVTTMNRYLTKEKLIPATLCAGVSVPFPYPVLH